MREQFPVPGRKLYREACTNGSDEGSQSYASLRSAEGCYLGRLSHHGSGTITGELAQAGSRSSFACAARRQAGEAVFVDEAGE